MTKKREISLYCYHIPGEMTWSDLKADRVYLPVSALEHVQTLKDLKIKAYCWIPAVLSDRQMVWYLKKITPYQEKLDGVLAGNIGILHRLHKEYPKLSFALDFQMNIFNSWAIRSVQVVHPSSVMASVELNMGALQKLNSPQVPLEVYVYGEIPVMTLEYCVGSNAGNCDGKCGSCNRGKGYLTDRMGEQFFYHTDPNLGRTTLYNSKRLMLEDVKPLTNTDVSILRIGMMDESAVEIHEICRFYHDQWVQREEKSALDPTIVKKLAERGLTRGHYYRGVE